MSERERWVVYPLLFLALGAALRDKLIDQTTTKSIKCQELLVIEERPLGQEVLLARIGGSNASDTSQSSGGEMLLNGQLIVVDSHGLTKLVSIGRDERQGTPPKGRVLVQGQVLVDGKVNAMHYLYRGVPFMPALRAAVPGLPDFLRTLPQAQPPAGEAVAPQQTPPSNSAQPEAPAADAREDASGEDPTPEGAEAPTNE
jgi:hypothetical protein